MEANQNNQKLANGSKPNLGIHFDPKLKLEDVIKFYIVSSVKHYGSKKAAAHHLGITHATINNKLKLYGLHEEFRKRKNPIQMKGNA
jgi:transcriptional regulator of aromatic amino acid metabolism